MMYLKMALAIALCMFIYWCGGGEFERGEGLAFAMIVSLALASYFPMVDEFL